MPSRPQPKPRWKEVSFGLRKINTPTGVRRASVSMAAEALQNAGVISYHRGSITIQHVARLEATSCEDYLLCRAGYDHLRA
jgi:hypothetical protein